ncbi:MAG TPA: hypothetical protein VHZ51_18160 [Ktedonobacteraceae bacterium]|jgi:hypothetical protein|nr:hypothetical protein [Ktedonobacteraceae bacterium]
MFYKVSYRRAIIEGLILYTLGRLCALISPAVFPGWLFVAIPLLFQVLQYLFVPYWTTQRIVSTKRERLSKRFWLLGLRLALMCFGINLIISLCFGLPTGSFGTQLGPVLVRMLTNGPQHLSLVAWLVDNELRTLITLLALHTLVVISCKLARGGMLRFTMPAGGNRVTL